MRILITNDDGINAPGLAVMQAIAAKFSDDVWTVAPETDQSGLAHSLTLNHPLRLREVAPKTFAVNGTPTDCVIMGVRQVVDGPVDLVLSGVNAGQNVGDYVTYSGTVAGAMEGVLLGIRSIALSQAFSFDSHRKVPWETVEAHGEAVIRSCLDLELPKDTLININFPNCGPDDVAGIAVSTQGKFEHGLGIGERADGRGLPYYWLEFIGEPPVNQPGTDIAALAENRIAVSPIRMDMTDHGTMDMMRDTLKDVSL
ncbi:5'/3'-nucleotidase SurE [Ahrensia sp. R2A130]|uniref:5'/3'-nucleotidase SurE n=1 Tax=Ahrensia sp. R2A130 TaxID=744979 RepID=UPI0001E0E855|nr:5'/3'-nucleotidase SurE [Ahrensia sp. R2A130]EFL90379.1 5'/3'-nucleotidase SurE [Ahrensia sp. R2A130]